MVPLVVPRRSIRLAVFHLFDRGTLEGDMAGRPIRAGVGTVPLALPAAPAPAQQAQWLAGKTGCMAKKAAGLLKCEAARSVRASDPVKGGQAVRDFRLLSV